MSRERVLPSLRPSARRVGLLLGAVAALSICLGAASERAHATSSCVSFALRFSHTSCVDVRHNGRNVIEVRGGVGVAPFRSFYGHFEVWGSGFHYDSPAMLAGNPLPWRQTVWGSSFKIERTLPWASRVCARAWTPENGRYKEHGIACVQLLSYW
jgi:hypothetical protein